MRIHWLIFALLISSTWSCNRCRYGCVNGICQKRICQCDVWYEGDACDRSELAIYAGDYSGTLEVNQHPIDTLSFSLGVSAEDPSVLRMTNLNLNLQFIDHSRFEISPQKWKGIEVKGEGEMLIDIVSLRFESTDDSKEEAYFLEARMQN